MLRLLFPAFALMGAALVLFAGALGDRIGSHGTLDRAVPLNRSSPDPTAAPLRPEPQQSASGASRSTDHPDAPQADRDALQRQVQTLQQQTTTLQQQLTQRSQELDQRTQQLERRTREVQAAQAEADKLRLGFERIRQPRPTDQATEQFAARPEDPEHRKQDVGPRQQPPAQLSQDPEAARADAERLAQVIDTLRQHSKSEEPTPTRQRTEAGRQKPRQQPAASAQPPAATPATELDATMPAPPAQQLVTARQWLAAGRPDEARRLLTKVQTQIVLQPVTPDAPEARGASAPAGYIGTAIRWLDMGASDRAMQAINRAIEDSSDSSAPRVPAWSGYSQPYGPSIYSNADRR
jgi:hypothetical protein